MAETTETERIAALEANRDNDVRRIGKLEDGLVSIRNLGWGILGAVVAQLVITGLKHP